jgi:LysR family transcriptional regulator, glycine cleavage system transcriptional activator
MTPLGCPMPSSLPPLNWLRAFEASARHLSFTQAAQELNLTQAAISKQVKLLELHLREPLFERKARHVVLTRLGEAYLPKVRDAFAQLSAGTREIFGDARASTLTIRMPVSLAVNWLASRLPAFLDAHPHVAIRILSSVWQEESTNDLADLDIRYGLGHWPGFRSDPISTEVLEPLCLPKVAARLKAPDDLAGQRLLHVLGYREGWATWLTGAGATKVDAGSGLQVDTSLLAFEIAANGGGIALGRHSLMAKELAAKRLVRPFKLAVPAKEGFHLVYPEPGMTHRDATTFRTWILAESAKNKHG